MFNERFAEILRKHEADRLYPYRCSAGKLTIGTGHNIEDNGIPQEVSDLLLKLDIKDVLKACRKKFPWFCALGETRRIVVASMVFNLGMPRFLRFKKTLNYLEAGQFDKAAVEMLDSRWAIQVGRRAVELSNMMAEG